MEWWKIFCIVVSVFAAAWAKILFYMARPSAVHISVQLRDTVYVYGKYTFRVLEGFDSKYSDGVSLSEIEPEN